MSRRNSQAFVRSASIALALASAAHSFGSATQSGGVLTINTTSYNTDQQMEFNVGPVNGNVQLSGVLGASTTQFSGVTSIVIVSGPKQDYIELRMFAEILPTVSVSTGTGNSDVKVIYDPPSSATSVETDVLVVGGAGNDKATFEVLKGAPTFIASWQVQSGNGNNEAYANVQSAQFTDLLAVAMNMRGGTGEDKFELSIVSDATAVDIAANPALGSGKDSVKIVNDAINDGDLNLLSFASLGDGLDVYELVNVQRGGVSSFFGFVDAGTGNDSLKFSSEAPGTMNLTLSGGAGADVIDWFAKGNVTGTPKLIGGTGNDVLKLVVDGPHIATPFIDGGPGFDIAIGFGTIINCEQVN